ncbi:MAG: 2-hydroxy-3-oxopropionate reductase [Betaproteobacteria bacterium]|nr:2-hydroxy-3-oxopropionate reductase [Betaproteobacteria bacterium]
MAAVNASTRIGFIGLGVMGKAMARNIARAGYKLTVHNRSRPAVEELVAEGAADGGSSAKVAAATDVVCLCLPDTPDVEAVLSGENGVVKSLRAGMIVIDFSTISATSTAAFAASIAKQGASLLDSPVSGGPQGAIDGTLTCMVGGDAAAFERAQPIFSAVGRTITYLGSSGAGQTCKACNQLVVAGTMVAVAEALALARKAGLNPYTVREALLGGSAQSFVLQNHAKRLLDNALKPGFRAGLMLKDLKLALGVGRDLAAFMPATALTTQLYHALSATGRDGLDAAALGLLIEELSGLKRGA